MAHLLSPPLLPGGLGRETRRVESHHGNGVREWDHAFFGELEQTRDVLARVPKTFHRRIAWSIRGQQATPAAGDRVTGSDLGAGVNQDAVAQAPRSPQVGGGK